MSCNLGSKQVSPVNVDAPELPDPIDGVVDGVHVLYETSRGDQSVNLVVVGGQDVGDARRDRSLGGDIALVSRDLWWAIQFDKPLAYVYYIIFGWHKSPETLRRGWGGRYRALGCIFLKDSTSSLA